MLRLRFRAPALLLFVTLFLALPACDELTGDGDGDDEPQHDPALVGEWVAVSALYTSAANSSQHFDGILQGGGFMLLVLDEDGTVTLTEYDQGSRAMLEDGGTWYTDANQLIIDWVSEPEPQTVTYQITGGFVVVDVGEEDFDFNDDGTDELASFVVTFADLSDSPDADLIGSWEATSMVFTSIADPATSVDVIQEYGAAFTLQSNADGTYAVEFTYPDENGTYTETESGVYTSIEGLLWVYDSDSVDPELVLLFYDVDGSTATLAHTIDEEFDFNNDGIAGPAIMTIELAKQ